MIAKMGTCGVRKQIDDERPPTTVGDKELCIMHERLFGTKGADGASIPARDSSPNLINLISDRAHAGGHSIEFDRRVDNASDKWATNPFPGH